MPGWFSPQSPLDTWEKTWTETRMRWLAERLGIDRLLRAEVVLPTDDYFPDPYHGTVDDARRLLDRLCVYVDIDPLKVELEVWPDAQVEGAAGPHHAAGVWVIRVAASKLADPLRLLATLAHELAHGLLDGGRWLNAGVEDQGGIIDLLTVYLGMGVFGANATISEAYGQDGHLGWWRISRQGYLPARVFGYALALFVFVRGEEDSSWAKHLRPDAAAALDQGLRYLERTGDSLFHPDTIRRPRRPTPAGEQAARLETGSASARLASLWEIQEHPAGNPVILTALIQCLDDADPAIPGEAARCLAALGAPAAGAVPQLVGLLNHAVDRTRAGAAYALGVLAPEPEAVTRELCPLLADHHPEVVAAAAGALGRFGAQAEAAAEPLLAAFETALIKCDQPLIDILSGTLLAVAADARRKAGEYFRHRDPELRRLAREVLREQRQLRSPGMPAAEPLGYPKRGSAEERGFTGVG